MNYGYKLKELREKSNLYQKDIADLLGISQPTYNHFETQYDIMPLKHFDKLCNYYNVSIDYILGLTNEKTYYNNKKININLFATRLKEFRKEKKITQKNLAELINTTHTAIVGYEHKRCFIPTYALYVICKKYHISADYLLGRINEPKYIPFSKRF